MSRNGSPTLEDVAAVAQVSTATVSRALNEPGRVAKPTLDRIEAAIAKLGYTPNFGGRALAGNRTNTVGAVFPSMANAMFANGLQAFQEELDAAGRTLLLAFTGYDPAREFNQIRALVARGAEGLLLIGTARPEETRQFLALRRVPHVLGWCHGGDPNALHVGFDNAKAAQAMADRVLDLGHRRIAMISGVTAGNDRAQGRIDGVRAAVAARADQGARITRIVHAPFLLAEGGAAFRSLMRDDDLPTAVICGNDVLAAGAVVAAREIGVDVPGAVSVTGFDDIGAAAISHPGLTTVHVPQIEMGQAAARLLLALVAGQGGLDDILLPTHIVMRGSLALPVKS
ncbi:LacI family DNA-binding transcriptional regulator [Oceaniovalibus sp. ACAM 378]|uniref:LacI family DNA-binding transcriptional regulator n=1 Tax=Oceaniovalibus sp. ACAM 378 TaxID=2599923 RepID=UPI0011D3FD8F|nr:LacI family DNA-binding transcriptional regulator [Oceaniovalibus sp. ACAM 378]TYB89041.1 LacI family DNA-binding transcriptional regulator [Oceaniovalibus sp. ACAM 378]